MTAPVDDIYLLEELAANAWPAEVVQFVDGWRFRYTLGVSSRRVNSVWPNNLGKYQTLNQKLTLVKEFYARRDLPARYQICPAAQPPELDSVLAGRGYTVDARTHVQSTMVETILNQLPATPEKQVMLFSELPDTWFDFQKELFLLTTEQAAARKAAFARIGPQPVFAWVMVDGRPAGIGLGILERGWLGIFSMLTRPDLRRQGLAAAILRALAAWGQANGATQAYLQVMENNEQALSLYATAGFTSQYQYYYRQSP
jgi:GNAT superfamily N-acetyltransferase